MEIYNPADFSFLVESLLMLRIENGFNRIITEAKIDSETNLDFKRDLLKDYTIDSEKRRYGACEEHRKYKKLCESICPERICKEVISEVLLFRIKNDTTGKYNYLSSFISKNKKNKTKDKTRISVNGKIIGRPKKAANKSKSLEKETSVPFIEEEICNSENYMLMFNPSKSSIDFSFMQKNN